MKTARAVLLRAALLIEQDADMWFGSEVNRCPSDPNFGKVEDKRMSKEIQEKKAIAKRLREMAGAQYRKALKQQFAASHASKEE